MQWVRPSMKLVRIALQDDLEAHLQFVASHGHWWGTLTEIKCIVHLNQVWNIPRHRVRSSIRKSVNFDQSCLWYVYHESSACWPVFMPPELSAELLSQVCPYKLWYLWAWICLVFSLLQLAQHKLETWHFFNVKLRSGRPIHIKTCQSSVVRIS